MKKENKTLTDLQKCYSIMYTASQGFSFNTETCKRFFQNRNEAILFGVSIKHGVNEISKSFGLKNQHIYITNDEKIKEGDWYLLSNSNNLLIKCVNNDIIKAHPPTIDERKKIILTTDQDLIKDGVQAIDDEFLEWFVKNPGCEEVKIESWQTKGEWELDYKIIIPKEEPKQEQKQHLIEIMRGDEELGLYEEPKQECTCGVCDNCEEKESIQILKEAKENALKQETLEEAAERIYGTDMDSYRGGIVRDQNFDLKRGFVKGAKWQMERMYSEEDMKQFAFECVGKFLSNDDNKVEIKLVDVIIDRLNKHFEQFKKK